MGLERKPRFIPHTFPRSPSPSPPPHSHSHSLSLLKQCFCHSSESEFSKERRKILQMPRPGSNALKFLKKVTLKIKTERKRVNVFRQALNLLKTKVPSG